MKLGSEFVRQPSNIIDLGTLLLTLDTLLVQPEVIPRCPELCISIHLCSQVDMATVPLAYRQISITGFKMLHLYSLILPPSLIPRNRP